MKKIMTAALVLISFSSFAQIIPVDRSAYAVLEELTKSHSASPGVEQIKQEIEQKYSVKCEGSSLTILPDVTKQVKYTADCVGKRDLKLIIKSKFKAGKDKFEFRVKSYKVEL